MSVTLKQFVNDFTAFYNAHKQMDRKCSFSINEFCVLTDLVKTATKTEFGDWNTIIIGTKECDDQTLIRLQELARKRPDAMVVFQENGEYKSPHINMGIGAVPINLTPMTFEDFIALLNQRNVKSTDNKTLRELSYTYGSKIVFDDLYVVDNTWYTRSQLSAEFPKITFWDNALFPKVQIVYLRIHVSMFSGPFLRGGAQDFIKSHPAFVKAFLKLPTKHFPRMTNWDSQTDAAFLDCGFDNVRICEKDGKIILSPASGYYPKPTVTICECLEKFGVSWPDAEVDTTVVPVVPKEKFTVKPFESDTKLLHVSCDDDSRCICRLVVAPLSKDKYVLVGCSYRSGSLEKNPCSSAKERAEKLGIAILAEY